MGTNQIDCHPDFVIAKAYLFKHQSCTSRGIDFLLSFSEFKALVSSTHCFYTGVKLTPQNFTIDRIDAKKPYTADNSVACSKTFNKLKGTIENPNNSLTIESVIRGLMLANERINPDSKEKFVRRSTVKKGKLTEDDVREIRASSLKLRELSAIYGVSIATLSHIRTRMIHKDV